MPTQKEHILHRTKDDFSSFSTNNQESDMQATASTPKISLQRSILRAYDIRGVVEESLSPEIAYAIGRAFATMISRKLSKAHPTIAMARDGRVSSPALSEALRKGMLDSGAVIKNTGIGPTPMLYFAAHHLKTDAGIMVTGSHNPPHHNGFKMTLGTKPFYGDLIQELGNLIEKNDFLTANGSEEMIDLKQLYAERIASDYKKEGAKSLKVVWDPGNGAAGEITELVTKLLPGEHILINTKLDGTFPNHHPDPTVPENMQQLIDKVAETKADFGVAFDGDGDRIGAVDAAGNILWGDQMMMFFSREILSRKPGAAIIADVKASQILFDDVKKNGGEPIMWKTGHSLIKAKMAETGAAIAGEMSGHIFFADGYYGFDDGIYSAVRLIDLVAHSKETLTEMVANIPHVYNTPEIRIDVDPARKFDIVEEIRDRLLAMQKAGEPIEVNEVDGVRVKAHGGWWLARASNTQSALIARCEAQDEKSLEALKQMVIGQLKKSGIDSDLTSTAH